MKTRLLLVVLASAFVSIAGLAAEGPPRGDKKAPPPKGPADLAFEDFMKLIADRSKLGQPHFKKITTTGIAFLTKNPTHNRANEAVRQLAEYPASLRDKALAPQRTVYITTLKYDLLDARIMAETDEAKTALAALDAGAADAEMRDGGAGPALETLREKIDTLAGMPGSERFLVDREKSYYAILSNVKGVDKAAAHLRALAENKDKRVADMAKQELNLLEISGAPYEMKFTALDGKEVDFASLRGKVVAMYFWSSTNGNSTKAWDGLKVLHGDYKKKGFEIVTVSFDKAEDRDKLAAHVKENGIKWPVYFDGKGNKSEFASKLAVNGVPRVVIFDQKGIMKSNNLQLPQLEGAIKTLLNIK
jgi:glutathione peroxidase-family protein